MEIRLNSNSKVSDSALGIKAVDDTVVMPLDLAEALQNLHLKPRSGEELLIYLQTYPGAIALQADLEPVRYNDELKTLKTQLRGKIDAMLLDQDAGGRPRYHYGAMKPKSTES